MTAAFVVQNNASIFGIRDIQLRPTLLEEVFMTITKKAELERAEVCIPAMRDRDSNSLCCHSNCLLQHEGRYETLILAEEQVGLRIPIGAEYIKSPGRCEIAYHLYHSWIVTI